MVTAEYSDGSSKVLSAGFAVDAKGDALDTTKTGKYTYVVTYGGKTAEYTLEVIERTVQSLEVTKIPDKTTYLRVRISQLTVFRYTLYMTAKKS